MTTVTEILRGVHDSLKLGFQTDFISGNVAENNLYENKIEALVVLDKSSLTFTHSLDNGGSVFTYPQIRMLFVKLDKLEATDEQHEAIMVDCMTVYNQFINRLRKIELIKIANISGGYVYNDQDANLTGIYCTFQLTQNSTDSLCTL